MGRFVSADSVVPGSASGGMDGVAVKPLTVDVHEGGFLNKLSQENALGFWFQLSDEQRQQAGSPWGPVNAQALNRYSYVQNNPVRYIDPTGHITHSIGVTLRVGFLFGGSLSVGLTWDNKGNSSLYVTPAGGQVTGASIGGSYTFTTAKDIYAAEGGGFQQGGNGGVLGPFGVDVINVQSLGKNDESLYSGFSVGLGVGTDLHSEYAVTNLVKGHPDRDPCIKAGGIQGVCGDSGIPVPAPTSTIVPRKPPQSTQDQSSR